MNFFTALWSRLGLQLRLQILIQGFLLIILVAAQFWISNEFEHRVITAAEDRAKEVADGAINGLNTLMLIKVGKDEVISDKVKRGLFIKKMGASEKIKEMRIVRGKGIDDEFDEGLPEERPVDDLDRHVLATGHTEIEVVRNGDQATLRTVMPFIATKNFRTTNCLECHGVDDGATIGAASVTIDIKDDLALISRINTWIWAGQALLQIVLFFVIGLIVRRLLVQLGGEPADVIAIAQEIAKGDLSRSIATQPGDNGSLLTAIKKMQLGLREIIGGIRQSAEALAQSSSQLTQSSHKVLKASELQFDASTATAASVEEMTVCIAQISQNAEDAQQHASDTGLWPRKAPAFVYNVIEEMNPSGTVTNASEVITSLGEQSHQISDIVKVIKEIADQTNLLALNAAIEAARAGEQGRGFAVVADEVRKLAERTTASTQEIAAMIHAVQGGTSDAVSGMSEGNARVKEGVEMVGNAGVSMERIQQGVQSVLSSVSEISASLREQNTTSTMIAGNVEGIARMTEENRSVIREVSAAADHLNKLAVHLKESVGQFRL